MNIFLREYRSLNIVIYQPGKLFPLPTALLSAMEREMLPYEKKTIIFSIIIFFTKYFSSLHEKKSSYEDSFFFDMVRDVGFEPTVGDSESPALPLG